MTGPPGRPRTRRRYAPKLQDELSDQWCWRWDVPGGPRRGRARRGERRNARADQRGHDLQLRWPEPGQHRRQAMDPWLASRPASKGLRVIGIVMTRGSRWPLAPTGSRPEHG